MIKNIATFAILLMCLFTAPSFVRADDSVCVTQYGGGTVCGAKTPEFHAPVNAGLADFNIPVIGVGLIGVAGYLYFRHRKQIAH